MVKMQKVARITYNGQLISLVEHMLALEGVKILDLSMLVPGACWETWALMCLRLRRRE
jgi:hypothetical protein